ncbi:MAG: tRNA 2-thiouridine(34) synthase MnmA, partial [Candidatus Dormibacteraeota bacterium]|nr:tRNA 2-thiouridine(34) synthase MnmA [Candidatus Dormibacteraeota bacterium]
RRLAGRFRPGAVVDSAGRRLGEHEGLPFFTVGQRSGLRLDVVRPDTPPLYVLELRAEDNTLVVGERERLAKIGAAAADCTWTGRVPPRGLRCQAQLRAHGAEVGATVIDTRKARVEVVFDEPAMQVAPGQSLVLLKEGEVLGGGIIEVAA